MKYYLFAVDNLNSPRILSLRILLKVAHDTIVSQNNRQLNDYDRLHVAEKIAIFGKNIYND